MMWYCNYWYLCELKFNTTCTYVSRRQGQGTYSVFRIPMALSCYAQVGVRDGFTIQPSSIKGP